MSSRPPSFYPPPAPRSVQPPPVFPSPPPRPSSRPPPTHVRGASSSRTVLITGATAGIGRTAALVLAAAGHHVIAAGRRVDALRALRAQAGGAIDVIVLDVTREDSIQVAEAEVDRLTGGRGIDVLVNNAGYGLVGPLEEISSSDLRAQFETNVFGLMAVTRAFLPAMRRRGSGRIVNVSSLGGRVTFPFMGAYNATKYALESLSDALRNELAPFGIAVSLVEPGAIHSEFANRAMATASAYGGPGSPYARVLARADETRRRFDATAAPPEVVARAIQHAVEARRPRVRYVVPFRTRFFLALFSWLPTRLTDWLLRAAFGPSAGAPQPAPFRV